MRQSPWVRLRSGVSISIVEGPFPIDWAHGPDPMIHSWRWLQPEAAFFRGVYEETHAMVRQFRADFERQLFGEPMI